MSINLNEEQSKIVKYEGDKFLSVQAGPGSGKTRVLVEKVKYMVKNLGVRPESLLIITFSTDAAEELKDRLIDDDISSSVTKSTFAFEKSVYLISLALLTPSSKV